MRRAGTLRHRIELQSFVTSEDGDRTSGTWTTQDTAYAERMGGAAVERFTRSQELATASQAFRIRWREDVDPTWRVKHGTDLWDIVGSLEGDGYREETIIFVARFDPRETAA